MTEHRCNHWENGKQIPCPPMCPIQSWPEYMFKRSMFSGGHWRLRKEYR